MILVFLLVILSASLKFDGLTLTTLWNWFNAHPFIFLFTVETILNYTKYIKVSCNKDKEIV